MPTRWSVLSSVPFVAKTITTHFLHMRLFISGTEDQILAVRLGAIIAILSFYSGLFFAKALGESKQQTLVQQSLVQQLQKERLEQLEGEKDRMRYDLQMAQKQLMSGGWSHPTSTGGSNSEIADYLGVEQRREDETMDDPSPWTTHHRGRDLAQGSWPSSRTGTGATKRPAQSW